MKRKFTIPILGLFCGVALSTSAASSSLLGWNNLGMHCMDRDFSVFSVLPPYNTIEAQLIVNGKLVKSGSGYTVTYEAVADPDGSVNTTSKGKGNFYDFTSRLYGPLSPDQGLVGWSMPGPLNTPQQMLFEVNNTPAAGVSTPVNWFRAEGIPITPYDDAGKNNPYPLMRLVAHNSTGQVLTYSDVVLPVSDEMDCRACHASGSGAAAQPKAGWVTGQPVEREYRLNILRLHDERQFQDHAAEYAAALAAKGFSADGLYANVMVNGTPVLCAACHASEALQAPSYGNIPPLTAAVHSRHATVMDPVLNLTLDDSANRAACYRCHPGSTTKCLRGAMGSAVAADGSMAMQCQSCHGSMSQVGSLNRVGWFMEPNCQSCHSGTATHNNGQIRYTSVFQADGSVRVPADNTFATTPNTPAAGLSLYRFSVGHGGLQCSACHGSTHAEFPASHRNDNIRNIQMQGHAGVTVECTACHATMPTSPTGGPHGMHPIGQDWVYSHHDAVSAVGRATCQACHGVDYRGTELSRAQGDRTFSALGTQKFFRGATIGCYNCHNGPSSSTPSSSVAPTVSDVSAQTAAGTPVIIPLPLSGSGATLRIISQPANGTVGLSGTTATYFPDPTFAGTATFTFAAYNGAKNSSLATGTVLVGAPPVNPPVITTQPASQTVTEGTDVTFSVVATGTEPLSYQWAKEGADLVGQTGSSLVLAKVTLAAGGNYSVKISNGGGTVISQNAVLTVKPLVLPPVITTQPVSQEVAAGSPVTFSVVATGTAPLKYQWQKNGLDISGATTSTLAFGAVSAADVGTYTVVVSNGAGSTTSSGATLKLLQQPPFVQITSPRNGAAFRTRQNITLQAEALDKDGTITSVQFYSGGTRLGAGTATSTRGPNGGIIYALTWRRVPAGSYTLTAVATDNSGLSTTSAPVGILVGASTTGTATDH